jgi:hypothetical protein
MMRTALLIVNTPKHARGEEQTHIDYTAQSVRLVGF